MFTYLCDVCAHSGFYLHAQLDACGWPLMVTDRRKKFLEEGKEIKGGEDQDRCEKRQADTLMDLSASVFKSVSADTCKHTPA